MRKYINFIKISVVLMVVGLAGCYEQEVSPVVDPGGLGYTSATFTTDFTGPDIKEGDTIKYTITISKAMSQSLTFSINLTGGTASDDDFEVSGGVIEPYATETELVIAVLKDYKVDEDATAEIEVGCFAVGEKYTLLDTKNPTFDLVIENYVSPALEITMAWNKDVFLNAGYEDFPDYGWEKSTCEYMDFDLEIYTEDYSDVVAASYGDCPEATSIEGLPDGTYHVTCLLWENWFITDLTDEEFARLDSVPVPVTFSFVRQGSFSVEVEQPEDLILSSKSTGYWDSNLEGPTGAFPMYFGADILIKGDKYTIITDAGEVGSGKNVEFDIRSIAQRK